MPQIFGCDLNGPAPPGTNAGDFVRWNGTQWETAAPAVAYSPGSFTVATENFLILSRHLKLTTTQRATLQGTATLRIS